MCSGALWVASIIIPHQLDITTEWNKQNRVQAAKSISIIDKLKQIRIMRLEDMTLRYLKRFEVRQAALSSSIRLMLAFTLLSGKILLYILQDLTRSELTDLYNSYFNSWSPPYR